MARVKHYRGGKRKAVRVEDKPTRTHPQRRAAPQQPKPAAVVAETSAETEEDNQ